MKKNIIIISVLMTLLFFAFTSTVLAQNIEHQFDISIGSGAGYTEFKIGDIDTTNLNYGFKSLLEFPLDVEMLNLTYANNFRIPYLNIGGISIRLEKNLNDEAGTFKDSDWVSTTGMNTKDIIGISPTKVKDITRWDFKLRNDWLRSTENIEYTIYLGYRQDSYDLLSYNLEQTYLTDAFGEPAGTTVRPPGDSITYEATYDIPYIGFGLKTNKNKLDLLVNVSYSNWAKIKDEDNHLHRDLTVKGQGEGDSIILNGKASYILTPATNIFLNIGYNKTEIKGTQDQFHSDGSIYRDLYYEAEQEYTNVSLGLNWKF